MAITEKPTALQTDNEKATVAFESFLTPVEDNVVETAEQQVEEVIEEDELPEAAELEEEEVEEDEDAEYDDEIDDDEQTEVYEEQEQPTYKVKVDGQEVEVTLEELQSGYSRQQDYTRKTQELSVQRQTLEQQAKEIAEQNAIYSQLLPQMKAKLKGEMADQPDWKKLAEDDPFAYVREKQIWDEKKAQLEAIDAEQKRINEEEFIKQQQEISNLVAHSQQKLLEIIPEWQNEEVAQKEKNAIKDYAINKLGYSEQEIAQVYDYRALLGLREAWMNNQTKQAVKKKPTEKAKARVARPGTVNRPKSVSRVKKAKQRLAKTGKPSDAAKVFEQMLK